MSYAHFEVKEHHIRLLKKASLRWEDGEFGAPAIDCKRPYGDSCVYESMAEILNIEYDAEQGLSYAQQDYLYITHLETLKALAIFLSTGVMEAGHYKIEKFGERWQKV